MDDPKVMNKLVFDYLAEHSSKKMANDFAKSVGKKNIQEKLDGIPSILHMVSELVKTVIFLAKGNANLKSSMGMVLHQKKQNLTQNQMTLMIAPPMKKILKNQLKLG